MAYNVRQSSPGDMLEIINRLQLTKRKPAHIGMVSSDASIVFNLPEGQSINILVRGQTWCFVEFITNVHNIRWDAQLKLDADTQELFKFLWELVGVGQSYKPLDYLPAGGCWIKPTLWERLRYGKKSKWVPVGKVFTKEGLKDASE